MIVIESRCGILCGECEYREKKVKDGKINRLDEYYSDCGDAPDWRKAMNIGKPIEQGVPHAE